MPHIACYRKSKIVSRRLEYKACLLITTLWLMSMQISEGLPVHCWTLEPFHTLTIWRSSFANLPKAKAISTSSIADLARNV